jgi:hypothetical protein
MILPSMILPVPNPFNAFNFGYGFAAPYLFRPFPLPKFALQRSNAQRLNQPCQPFLENPDSNAIMIKNDGLSSVVPVH